MIAQARSAESNAVERALSLDQILGLAVDGLMLDSLEGFLPDGSKPGRWRATLRREG